MLLLDLTVAVGGVGGGAGGSGVARGAGQAGALADLVRVGALLAGQALPCRGVVEVTLGTVHCKQAPRSLCKSSGALRRARQATPALLASEGQIQKPARDT